MSRWLGVVLCLAGAAAWAEDGKVPVQVDAVRASTTGDEIDPPSLKAMQESFAEKVKYTSLKRISTQKLMLEKVAKTVALPNGKTASLSLESLQKDTATVRVKLPPSDATYRLGRVGSLYVQAGRVENADLWLVVSPSP